MACLRHYHHAHTTSLPHSPPLCPRGYDATVCGAGQSWDDTKRAARDNWDATKDKTSQVRLCAGLGPFVVGSSPTMQCQACCAGENWEPTKDKTSQVRLCAGLGPCFCL